MLVEWRATLEIKNVSTKDQTAAWRVTKLNEFLVLCIHICHFSFIVGFLLVSDSSVAVECLSEISLSGSAIAIGSVSGAVSNKILPIP